MFFVLLEAAAFACNDLADAHRPLHQLLERLVQRSLQEPDALAEVAALQAEVSSLRKELNNQKLRRAECQEELADCKAELLRSDQIFINVRPM